MRSWHLANGLIVEVVDDTINYYGDYYNVKLTIKSRIAVKSEYLVPLAQNPHFEKIAGMLGPVAEYRREIVKAGVPGKELLASKNHLVDKFEENALVYFEREDFPEKFVRRRFAEVEEELKKERHRNNDNGK
jgi:hypothetical protein